MTDETPETLYSALRLLLLRSFSAQDIRMLLQDRRATESLVAELPTGSASNRDVAEGAAELLIRHNLVNNELFAALLKHRPNIEAEIQHLRALSEDSPDSIQPQPVESWRPFAPLGIWVPLLAIIALGGVVLVVILTRLPSDSWSCSNATLSSIPAGDFVALPETPGLFRRSSNGGLVYLDSEGRFHELGTDITEVIRAVPSPSSNHLALLTQSGDVRSLYVYDINAESFAARDLGRTNKTTDIAWENDRQLAVLSARAGSEPLGADFAVKTKNVHLWDAERSDLGLFRVQRPRIFDARWSSTLGHWVLLGSGPHDPHLACSVAELSLADRDGKGIDIHLSRAEEWNSVEIIKVYQRSVVSAVDEPVLWLQQISDDGAAACRLSLLDGRAELECLPPTRYFRPIPHLSAVSPDGLCYSSSVQQGGDPLDTDDENCPLSKSESLQYACVGAAATILPLPGRASSIRDAIALANGDLLWVSGRSLYRWDGSTVEKLLDPVDGLEGLPGGWLRLCVGSLEEPTSACSRPDGRSTFVHERDVRSVAVLSGADSAATNQDLTILRSGTERLTVAIDTGGRTSIRSLTRSGWTTQAEGGSHMLAVASPDVVAMVHSGEVLRCAIDDAQ